MMRIHLFNPFLMQYPPHVCVTSEILWEVSVTNSLSFPRYEPSLLSFLYHVNNCLCPHFTVSIVVFLVVLFGYISEWNIDPCIFYIFAFLRLPINVVFMLHTISPSRIPFLEQFRVYNSITMFCEYYLEKLLLPGDMRRSYWIVWLLQQLYWSSKLHLSWWVHVERKWMHLTWRMRLLSSRIRCCTGESTYDKRYFSTSSIRLDIAIFFISLLLIFSKLYKIKLSLRFIPN